MSASPDPRHGKPDAVATRRRSGVRRTLLVLVVIVVAIYVAFILSGVVGR